MTTRREWTRTERFAVWACGLQVRVRVLDLVAGVALLVLGVSVVVGADRVGAAAVVVGWSAAVVRLGWGTR